MPETPLAPTGAGSLWGFMPHPACVLDRRARILSTNPAWCALLGEPSSDALFFSVVCAGDPSPLAKALERCRAGEDVDPIAARSPGEPDVSIWFEWSMARNGDGRVFAWGRDLTRQRRVTDAVEELRLLEDEAEQCAGLGSWRLDLGDGGLSWSPEMYRIFGIDPSTPLDLAEVTRAAVHPDDRAMLEEINRAVLEDGTPRPADYRILLPDGTVRWVNARGRAADDASGRAVAIIGFVQDITERVLADEALQASEVRYRSIIDGMQDGYFQGDRDGRIVLANQAATEMFGYQGPEAMVGLPVDSLYADVGERQRTLGDMERDGVLVDRVVRGRRCDGTRFWVSLNAQFTRDKDGGVAGTEGFARDVTERVAAEEARGNSFSLLKATLESTADGILVIDRKGKVASYNRRFVSLWGIPQRLLNVGDDAGLLDFVATQLIDPRAFVEGVTRLYLHPDSESFDVLEFVDGRVFERYSRAQLIGDSVVGRVWSFRDVSKRAHAERALRRSEEDLREAQAIARIGSYVYDLGSDTWTSSETMDDIFGIDPSYERDLAGWLALVQSEDRPMMSCYFADHVITQGLPFDKEYRVERHSDGETVWVHGHGRLETGVNGAAVRLIGTIQDITVRRRSEEDLRRTNESLERIVYDVAEAMGRVVEMRDPYTAGHQQRTARLARAIAEEMGLHWHDIAAVEMAAVVHDIGKLSVPVEILSRPADLSEIEFSLVREHPRNGFQILEDIPFPWPVAEIVLQHHERMDASGYPGHLEGADILPLARLLSVADVVEAMATHRPYRPALGLDAAMDELRSAPEKYDSVVVDACMRLYERGEIDL